ncbi:MAG: tripartite tricarboxylate transporter TctB family protein [Limimaricola soesokkakensis]|uniref:tripartite tricarboxylate transporter TctB family protein n=1 Tax=Limimaricola TaxID=2211638 RepID=UPI002AC89DB9|nr:tripartite tricarboxylate transporter TctB family protein [Limimaricola variabilis]WPY96903.1 tripartite tricarboxylate transporter TctB family protein [Limimaricola variabilis]
MHDPSKRMPGETAFAVVLVALSGFLLWQAYLIAGFEALSSPGAFPMAAAFAMLVSSLAILVKTLQLRERAALRFFSDVTPPVILAMFAMMLGYALLLKPLGFLPTSLLFLTVSIFALRRRGLLWSFGISLASLALVYVIFRLVFTVLMPSGIVPEGEILAWLGNLFSGEEAQ